MKYIDTEKLKELIDAKYKEYTDMSKQTYAALQYQYIADGLDIAEQLIDSLQQEQPEPYFYCKYGGTMPLCSDCKRNHNNSSFKTEEITTWYAPSNGTKHCIDYIQQKQPEVDLEKEINNCFPKSYFENGVRINFDDVVNMAHHFYELGLNARKEE